MLFSCTEGTTKFLPSNYSRRGMLSSKMREALVWFNMFVKETGEFLPNQEKVHLPPCLTRDDVYDLMKQQLTESKQTLNKSIIT